MLLSNLVNFLTHQSFILQVNIYHVHYRSLKTHVIFRVTNAMIVEVRMSDNVNSNIYFEHKYFFAS